MPHLTREQLRAALQKQVGVAVGSDFPNLNPSPTPVPTTTLADDNTTAAPASTTQINTNNPPVIFTPMPNLLKGYTSYNPVLSLLVTDTTNYNKLVTNQKFYPQDWDVICKSGGVGPKKAQGFGNGDGSNTEYFSRDMYIDTCNLTTIVGMNQENRGSNATDIEFTIVEPYGMDFIEQLYDYCNFALGEHNYCQLPYMLKIEFKGQKEDGTFETVPHATKFIPIHLTSMDIKVNNLGAIYKITAIPFNELGITEQYGRVPAPIQLGTELALAQITGLEPTTAEAVANRVESPLVALAVQNAANKQLVTGTAGIANVGTGGLLHEITDAFTVVLNNIQKRLLNEQKLMYPDTYSITYSDIPDAGGIGQYLFLDTSVLANMNVPTTAKDNPMGKPLLTEDKKIDVGAAGKNLLKYAVDPATGETGGGAITYTGAHLITFNSGSSIVDCLNTLIINSNYIVAQINRYNAAVDEINAEARNLRLTEGAPIPPELQNKLNKLNSTTLDWFQIIPTIIIGKYDPIRKVYARNVTYNIQPYKIYNARSISAPNGDPIAENRVVKEYDYIFTGKNTEILNFDLNFNNAFYTYAQFNEDTKIQGTGAGMPSITNQGTTLQTISSPISDGQFIQYVSNSTKTASGIGAQTPERVQAADIAATIYAIGEQIHLEMSIYGDPDYIRQDGLFINPQTEDAFKVPSGDSDVRGILFNSGEVYANISFKIPQDINLNTGLLDLSFTNDPVRHRRNVFSGQYRVITVTNKFEKALFTQQLELIRRDESHNYTINTIQSQADSTVNGAETEQQFLTRTTNDLATLKVSLPPSPPPVSDAILTGIKTGLSTVPGVNIITNLL